VVERKEEEKSIIVSIEECGEEMDLVREQKQQVTREMVLVQETMGAVEIGGARVAARRKTNTSNWQTTWLSCRSIDTKNVQKNAALFYNAITTRFDAVPILVQRLILQMTKLYIFVGPKRVIYTTIIRFSIGSESNRHHERTGISRQGLLVC